MAADCKEMSWDYYFWRLSFISPHVNTWWAAKIEPLHQCSSARCITYEKKHATGQLCFRCESTVYLAWSQSKIMTVILTRGHKFDFTRYGGNSSQEHSEVTPTFRRPSELAISVIMVILQELSQSDLFSNSTFSFVYARSTRDDHTYDRMTWNGLRHFLMSGGVMMTLLPHTIGVLTDSKLTVD